MMRNGQQKKAVDPKVADAIQPIYIVPPLCMDGLEDPLSGAERTVLLEGRRDSLDVEALWTSLPTLAAAHYAATAADAVKDADDAPDATRKRKARRTVRVPGQPIAADPAAAEIGRIRTLERTEGAKAIFGGCCNVYAVRVALEMAALAAHRGGLEEGTRDEGATRIASALVAGLPLGRDPAWVRAQVRTLLNPVAGEESVRVEWEQAGADASIVANYLAASRGEPGRNGRKDPRYTYGKARLIGEWGPSRDEILALRLRSLCSEADRAWLEREIAREDSKTPAREDWLLASRRWAPEVHRLRANGLSWRAVAEALGEPASNVQRLGKLSEDDLTAVVAFLEREEHERAAEIAEIFAMWPSTDRTPEDVVAALLDAGVDSADAIAQRTGLPRRLVTDILVDFGVLDENEAVVEGMRTA
jgi:hypothetical protein